MTILRTDHYDVFLDDEFVRLGMLYLEESEVAIYHSLYVGIEVLVFLNVIFAAKVYGRNERFIVGEVLCVPVEQKHGLAYVGSEQIEDWLTVTQT